MLCEPSAVGRGGLRGQSAATSLRSMKVSRPSDPEQAKTTLSADRGCAGWNVPPSSRNPGLFLGTLELASEALHQSQGTPDESLPFFQEGTDSVATRLKAGHLSGNGVSGFVGGHPVTDCELRVENGPLHQNERGAVLLSDVLR